MSAPDRRRDFGGSETRAKAKAHGVNEYRHSSTSFSVLPSPGSPEREVIYLELESDDPPQSVAASEIARRESDVVYFPRSVKARERLRMKQTLLAVRMQWDPRIPLVEI